MKRLMVVALGIGLSLCLIGCSSGGSKSTETKETPKKEETVKKEETAEPQKTPEPTPAPEPTPSVTTGQSNALKAAKNYLSVMPFSYTGLIEQLEFEKYSYEDAVYAVDNCGADWNAQAAKAAKNYLDVMPFSREGLIDQLVFEGYTYEQAVFGADSVDL